MARKIEDNTTAQALEEIEHLGDRIVEAISANPIPILAVIGGVLLVAGGIGGVRQYQSGQHDEATAAYETVRVEYFRAMGANPRAIRVEEPANPETARSVRDQYTDRFIEMAAAHPGTPSATLALDEAGNLRLAAGDPDRALELWQQALDSGPEPGLRGILLERVGSVHEDRGEFAQAGERYAEAAEVSGYPLRYRAMAHAARLFAEAGQDARAIALFKRVTAESPETVLPDHISGRLRELEALLN